MIRLAVLALLAATIGGCGLTETVGSAAIEANAKAQEIKQGKATEARAQSELDAAMRAADAQRQAGEAASQ